MGNSLQVFRPMAPNPHLSSFSCVIYLTCLSNVVRFTRFFLFFLYTSLLYIGLVTIYLWHTLYFSFHIYDDVCFFFTYLYMCCCCCCSLSLSLFIHMFLYVCNLFLLHTWCLDKFCLSFSERQVVKVYHAKNFFLAKFFKSLC